jgi:hypothetical protein
MRGFHHDDFIHLYSVYLEYIHTICFISISLFLLLPFANSMWWVSFFSLQYRCIILSSSSPLSVLSFPPAPSY